MLKFHQCISLHGILANVRPFSLPKTHMTLIQPPFDVTSIIATLVIVHPTLIKQNASSPSLKR
jgi:hypothetical protein